MTNDALKIIHDEHAALAVMLRTMGVLLDAYRKHGAAPDFGLFRAMLFYVDEYPEKLHHQKESALLFPRLRRRAPQLGAVLDRGYWFARSSGFVEVSAFHWLTWLRGVGATLFILGGVLPIAWMVLQGAGRLKPGKSRANEPVLEDRPVGHDPHGSKVVMDPSM